MTTPNEITSEDEKSGVEDESSSPPTTNDAGGGDEFQLTIKKLEMPVRPRGVLAD